MNQRKANTTSYRLAVNMRLFMDLVVAADGGNKPGAQAARVGFPP